MKTVITKTWRFRTVSIKGTCKCSICRKPITKSFSMELREDVPTTNEHIKELEIEKQEWLKESHICNACRKKKIEQERKDITQSFNPEFSILNDLQEQIMDLKIHKNNYINKLNEELKDKVILYNDKEYVINYVHDGYLNACAFEIWCSPISKTQPWLEASGSICFYKRTYKPLYFNNFIEIENCIITDESFTKRKELLNG